MQLFVGGGNAIFLLLTVVFTGLLTMVALLAWKRSNQATLRAATGVAGVVLGVYVALLLTAALGSRERILAQGEIKWFCGFYLDCHLGVSVVRVESAKNLNGPHGPVVANGLFKVVTLQFHNSARNPQINMTFYDPLASIVDGNGVRYQRSHGAEAALAASRSPVALLPAELSVTHEPLFATIVFDIPGDVPNPRLSIEEGFIVDRVIELVLVNDDNSILHKGTYLALGETSASPPTSFLRNMIEQDLRVRLASR